MTRIRIGNQWVMYVTEEVLMLTNDPDLAGVFSWEGQVRAEELVRYHLAMDEVK